MTAPGDAGGSRVRRYVSRFLRLLLAGGLYALVLWYGLETAENVGPQSTLGTIAVVLISLGIAGSIYGIVLKVFDELWRGYMVLAEFLNNKLLEPQRRRIAENLVKARAEARDEALVEGREEGRERKARAEGREEGRAEGREEGRVEGREEGREEGHAEALELMRELLRAKGLDPDEILGDMDLDQSEKC